MKRRVVLGTIASAGAVALIAATSVATAQQSVGAALEAESPATAEGTGFADVAVCSLPGMLSYGTSNGQTAFSIATTSVNLGTVNLTWLEEGTNHPVIAMNLYRLKDNVFEQIGMSWVKHGFCALQQTGCGDCQLESGCLDFLKPNCSDPYSATTNGNQFRLGPRSEVNPTDGSFIDAHGLPTGDSTLRGRLIVDNADIDPAQNPNARYFIEGLYIHPEDANAGSHPTTGLPIDNNNAGWREVSMAGYPFTNFESVPVLAGTFRDAPAMFAWQTYAPGTFIDRVEVPGDGHYVVGSRADLLPDGSWQYEYAVYNMTGNRAAGSVTIPVHATAAVSNMGFNDIHHHSGEPYDGTDWAVIEGGTSVTWETAAATEDINANALRWGTMYNYRFTSDSAPVLESATIGLFLPGTPDSFTAQVIAPGPNPCAGDLNGDGAIDGADLGQMLQQWGDGPSAADLNGDAQVDGADLGLLLQNWGPCP